MTNSAAVGDVRHRIGVWCCVGAVVLGFPGSTALQAQTNEQLNVVVSLLPPDARHDVRVLLPTPDGHRVVRDGGGQFTCIGDAPGDERFAVSCHHKALEPYLERQRELGGLDLPSGEARDRLCRDVHRGAVPMPDRAYNLTASGPLRGGARVPDTLFIFHLLQIPFATEESVGIADEETVPGGPWLHHAGTCDAHIMWSETRAVEPPGASPVVEKRTVRGTTITSTEMPAARLTLAADLAYAGTQTIMLSATTMAEQHFFLESDGRRIKRLYWLQFEGRIGSGGRPYDYSRDPLLDVGGKPFHINFRYYPTSGFAGRAGSDGDQAQQFLERLGYTLGEELMRVRLVWLLDDPPVNELMIIYVEDLGDHGITMDEMTQDAERWVVRRAELLERAVEGMRLTSLEP